jgi:predicted GTPase
MEKSRQVSVAVLSGRSIGLIDSTRELFSELGRDGGELPTCVFDDDNPISLVFAGQYSAGKSTILKALTGDKSIATGHEITTNEVKEYSWGALRVIDTPGIHTDIRPNHDALSLRAIADADILVYVVTYGLFDDNIGNDFRELLVGQGKADEMILVVNKMSSADSGNTPEQREILKEGLAKVTEPYSPEDLRTVFIDAKDYLDSLPGSESDSEIAADLRKASNFDALVEALNSFAAEQGYIFRLTTPLYQLINVLQGALMEERKTSGDNDIDMLEENLREGRHVASSVMWQINSAVRPLYKEAAAEIREEGRKLADSIQDCKNKDEADELVKNAYDRVDAISDSCGENVVKMIEDISRKYESSFDELRRSDSMQNLELSLESKYKEGNPVVKRLLNSGLFSEGSERVQSLTKGTNAAVGLKAFTESDAHEAVLAIGHFFNYSFKPWEAVKWVEKINVAGKALGAFGIVLSFASQAKDDFDEDERERTLRDDREKIRAAFNSAAGELENHFSSALSKYLDEGFRTRIDTIDKQLDDIEKAMKGKSEACSRIEEKMEECKLLINDIHNQQRA